MSNVYRIVFGVMIAWIGSAPATAWAELITNPAMPISHRVYVNLILVSNDSGNNTATAFGDSTQRATIEGFVDDIWAQAGIDVEFVPGTTPWNNTFALEGTGANPRPSGDLSTIVSTAQAAEITHSDPNVLNLFFVERVPGFSWPLAENSSAGLAFIDANGIAMFVGDDLLTPPFDPGGLEAIASVTAHEIGHNLGLDHPNPALSQNLMSTGSGGQRLVQSQIDIALSSDFVEEIQAVPEPSTWAMMILAAVAALCYRWRPSLLAG